MRSVGADRHAPFNAVHAEPDNLRTLMAVIDPPIQWAESAAHPMGLVVQFAGLVPSSRNDDSLAAAYSVYSASRLWLTANRHASSHAPQSLEARGAAFGCHPRQDLSIPARCPGPGERAPRSTWVCAGLRQLTRLKP